MTQYDDRLGSVGHIDAEFEDPETRVERVRRCELPDHLDSLVTAYENTVGIRDRFLWKWLYFVFPSVTLSCVASSDEERVRDEKLLATLFVTLLDDVAEREMDRQTFEETAKVPFDHRTPRPDRSGVDEDRLAFAERVWDRLGDRVAEAPRHDEYEDLFAFDVEQNVAAIDYSYLVNQHLEMANVAESDAYDCNNMMLLTYANVDLMHSPAFDRDDLADLRRVLRKAQRMARIGNWVSTWERELREDDYSSGIVVYALENDVVDREELYKLSADRFPGDSQGIVDRIRDRGVEEVFLDKWHRNYQEVQQLADRIESVNVDSFVSGMEKLLAYHLATRGLK